MEGIEYAYRPEWDTEHADQVYNILHTEYADDITLFCRTLPEVRTILDRFYSVTQRMGMSINFKKSEIMLIDRNPDNHKIKSIKIHGEQIKFVTQTKHLGRVIHNGIVYTNDEHGLEVCNWVNKLYEENTSLRIQKGRGSFWRLYKSLWGNRYLPMSLKKQTFTTLVDTTTMFSLDVYPMYAHDLSRLQTMYRQCFKRMLCLPNGTGLSEPTLAAQLSLPDAQNRLIRRKLTLFSHIVRLRIDSPTRIVMLGRDTRIHKDGRIKTLYKENTKHIEQMYGPSSFFNSMDKQKFRSDLKRFNFVTGTWIVAPHRNM